MKHAMDVGRMTDYVNNERLRPAGDQCHQQSRK